MKEFHGYEVYEDGRVYSNKIKKFLKPAKCGSERQYYFLTLTLNDGTQKQFYIHRLVAMLFCNNEHNKPQVNHIDRNTNNNHYTNLEWVTAKENINHSINLGISPIKNFKEVDLYYDNIFIKSFKSKVECGKYVNENGGFGYAVMKYLYDSTGFRAYERNIGKPRV